MKTLIEYNLPEDKQEFMLALNGASAHFAISELLEAFRKVYKYDDSATDAQIEAALHWKDVLCEILADRGIKVWENY